MAPRWTNGSNITIERTGISLVRDLEVASDSASRRKGLLGRDSLAPGHALAIAPCQGVHTFGMRFAIDVVAVTREGIVIKIRSGVPPRRVVLALRAFAIIELQSGAAAAADLQVGDRLLVATRVVI